MNLAGAVILYNPTIDTIQNIYSYYDSISHLYILDNSSSPDVIKTHFKNNPKVTYIHDGENKGISVRLNQASTLAKQSNFDWLLTMDQDSWFDEASIKQYLSCINQFKKSEVALFGINYNTKSDLMTPCSFLEGKEVITSGSLVNLSIYGQINFDEALFIDEVDHDYCYQALQKGYRVIFLSSVYLNHSLGYLKQCRSFLTLKVTGRSIHSPLRSYYMLRNYFYIKNKFGKDNFDIRNRWKLLRNKLKNNFLYNDHKLEFIKFMIRAYYDFQAGKMGKYNKNR